MQKATLLLDLVGVICLTGGAFLVWAPLALFVFGAFALLASWRASS